MSTKDKDYVLRQAKELNIEFVQLWFTDILGFLKSVSIPVGELKNAMDEGMGFDGSSVEGFARIDVACQRVIDLFDIRLHQIDIGDRHLAQSLQEDPCRGG